jgi:hypothetical protein
LRNYFLDWQSNWGCFWWSLYLSYRGHWLSWVIG